MAQQAITRVDVFPETTVVNAYAASLWSQAALPPSGAPPGAASGSPGTMTGGVATITGLADGTRYYAGASVGGTWRYVSFRTANAATGVTAAPAISGTGATALGAAQAVTLSAAQEQWLLGTLSANLTITAAPVAGGKAFIFGKQDAVTPRTVTITDGVTPVLITSLPTALGAPFVIQIESDGTTNTYQVLGDDPFRGHAKVIKVNMAAITANTVLQDVIGADGSDLKVPLSGIAGEILMVRYRLIFAGANATMDAKFGFTFPVGVTAEGGPEGIGAGVTTVGYGNPLVGTTPTTSLYTETSTIPVGTGVAVRQGLALLFMVYGSATAGNWQLQIAQQVSDAAALQLMKGSAVEYQRVA